MRPLLLLGGLLMFATVAPALAQTESQTEPTQATAPVVAAQEEGVIELETMVVTGVQPGPGMWKVSKGDHELWILGTLSPLPNDITWLSRDVDAVLERTQEVVRPPGVVVSAKVGVFKGLALLPAAMRASKNAEGARLEEVLPADLYARWSVLKAKYLGRDGGIEKKRPIVAATELYERALHRSGLGKKPVISPVIDAAVKRRKLKPTSTSVEIVIDDPKAALKEFNATGVDDLECFRKTLDRIEGDLPLMVARANAWSIGDLEALRLLPYEDQQAVCMEAMLQTEVARKRGLSNLWQQGEQKWLQTIDAALDRNQVTFATLPVSMLLKPDGVLSKLRAKGYEVEEP